MSGRTAAVGRLVDERRRGGTGAVPVDADPDARERVTDFLVASGSVRRDADRAWVFGRRLVDDRFVLVEFGSVDGRRATLCLLPDTGHLLLDRGGPLLENEYVATLLSGYVAFHDGAFELHADPVGVDALRTARDELADAGLVDDRGEGKGPFAAALTTLADALDDAIAGRP